MRLHTALIQRLEEARTALQSLLPQVNPELPIYPTWRLKQLLDHLAGWDETLVMLLQAHQNGGDLAAPISATDLEAYNAELIAQRTFLSLEQSREAFEATRIVLKETLLALSEEKLAQPMQLPWGEQATLSQIIEIWARHEEEHTADLLRWLADPTRPLQDGTV